MIRNPLGPHKTTHQDGGADEITVAALSGLLADSQTPLAHKTSHQDAGTDEISLAALDGEPSTLTTHKGLTTGIHGVGAGTVGIMNADKTITDADADTKIQTEESADEDKIRMDVKAVEAFLLDDAGVLTLAKQSRARAYRATSGQTITTDTFTKVQLNAENYDEQAEFDSTTNYRFTAKTAGYYLAIGQVMYRATVANHRIAAIIRRNGSDIAQNLFPTNGQSYVTSNATDAVYLAVGDYLELWTYQDCGVNEIIHESLQNTFMAVHKLS